jgi:hypothetical protein
VPTRRNVCSNDGDTQGLFVPRRPPVKVGRTSLTTLVTGSRKGSRQEIRGASRRRRVGPDIRPEKGDPCRQQDRRSDTDNKKDIYTQRPDGEWIISPPPVDLSPNQTRVSSTRSRNISNAEQPFTHHVVYSCPRSIHDRHPEFQRSCRCHPRDWPATSIAPRCARHRRPLSTDTRALSNSPSSPALSNTRPPP